MPLKAAGLLLLAAGSASSSQVVSMELDQVVSWAGTIVVARLDSVEEAGCEDTYIVTFEATVLQIVDGFIESSVPFSCSYTQLLPETWIDDEGNETTEWPLVTGSGIEMFAEQGDTVVMLLQEDTTAPDRRWSVLRMEPLDSLESVVNLIPETRAGGDDGNGSGISL